MNVYREKRIGGSEGGLITLGFIPKLERHHGSVGLGRDLTRRRKRGVV